MMADILKSGHEEQLHPVHAGGGLSRLHGTAAAVLAALGAVDVVVLRGRDARRQMWFLQKKWI